MRHYWIAIAAMVLPNVLSCEELSWEVMRGPEIVAALEGREVETEDGEWIAFLPDGTAQGFTKTTQLSLLWRVSHNSLCIKLKDANQWGCYLWIGRKGDNFRFVGGPGDVTQLTYRK